MYATRYWISLLVSTALLTGVSANARGQTTDVNVLSVNDPRPLEAAVLSLIRKYDVSVTYEDPRYEYSGEMRDITDQVNKSSKPPKVRTIIPIGGLLQASYAVSRQSGQLASPADAIHAIVDAQNANAMGGRFAVQQSGDTFHIVPTEVRDSNGAWINQQSVLDTRITFSSIDGESAESLVESVLKEVSSVSGQKLLVGLFPIGPTAVGGGGYHTKVEAKNEPARDVLMSLLHSISPRLTWVLNYDPSDHSYYFNVMTIAAPPEPENTRTLIPPQPGTRTPGGPATRGN